MASSLSMHSRIRLGNLKVSSARLLQALAPRFLQHLCSVPLDQPGCTGRNALWIIPSNCGISSRARPCVHTLDVSKVYGRLRAINFGSYLRVMIASLGQVNFLRRLRLHMDLIFPFFSWIWDREAGLYNSTLFRCLAAMTHPALSDHKIVSGGDERLRSFTPELMSAPAVLLPPPVFPLVPLPVHLPYH
jgi:hypothetical protein